MWASVLVLESFGVGLLTGASIKDRGPALRHVLAEPSVLVFDLVGQLASMTKDNNRYLTSYRLDLLQSSNDENCRFA